MGRQMIDSTSAINHPLNYAVHIIHIHHSNHSVPFIVDEKITVRIKTDHRRTSKFVDCVGPIY